MKAERHKALTLFGSEWVPASFSKLWTLAMGARLGAGLFLTSLASSPSNSPRAVSHLLTFALPPHQGPPLWMPFPMLCRSPTHMCSDSRILSSSEQENIKGAVLWAQSYEVQKQSYESLLLVMPTWGGGVSTWKRAWDGWWGALGDVQIVLLSGCWLYGCWLYRCWFHFVKIHWATQRLYVHFSFFHSSTFFLTDLLNIYFTFTM